MRCGEISLQIQLKEKNLGTLETTYLVGMKKVELVSKGNGKKNIQKSERMFCCLISRNTINGRSVLYSAYKCKEKGKY